MAEIEMSKKEVEELINAMKNRKLKKGEFRCAKCKRICDLRHIYSLPMVNVTIRRKQIFLCNECQKELKNWIYGIETPIFN